MKARKQYPAECQYYSILTREFLEKKKKISLFTKHPPTIGSYHEELFKSFLKTHLPKSLSIATGFITNGAASSRQCDIIIYDSSRFSPLFQEGDFVVLGSEAAIAAIEVKANIEKVKTLHDAFDNLISVREVSPITKTFLLGFDARGLSLLSFELAIRKYRNLPIEQQIQAILILEKGWLWNCLDKNKGLKKFLNMHERDVPLHYFIAVIKTLCDIHLKLPPDVNRYFDMDSYARKESKREIQFGSPLVTGEKEYWEGSIFNDEKQYQKAINSLLKAKSLSYQHDDLDVALACAYGNLGNFTEALRIFESMGTKLRAKDDLKLFGKMLLNENPYNLINIRRGVELLEQSLHSLPHDLEDLVAIAYGLIRLGEHQRSIDFSKKALEYAPDDLMCIINIGLAYKKLNNATELEATELKAKVEKGDAWEQSLVFALFGERDKCLTALRKAIKANPLIKSVLFTTIEFEDYYKDEDFIKMTH